MDRGHDDRGAPGAPLPLFDALHDTAGPGEELDLAGCLARAHAAARELAGRLPDLVRFGTSSWSFPGWAGLVYGTVQSQTRLAREGLLEYARHPLLRTVGIDRSYYAPIPVEDLRRYGAQLPPGFPCCLKAPAAVGSAVLPGAPHQARPRPLTANPDFLSAERLARDLLEPCLLAFGNHLGPIIIECAPLPRGVRVGAAEFIERLDAMLGALPAGLEYAVELRHLAWLTEGYVRVLERHRAAHVFNYWSAMPMPGTQAGSVPVERLPFVVVRLLLRPGTWYEQQRRRFHPFDRIVEPDEDMRADVLGLLRRAIAARLPAYVIVNNKAEGSAPLTIVELARRLADDDPDGPSASRRPPVSR